MRLKIKHSWIRRDELLALFESDWHTDRIGFGAAMPSLNDEDLAVHLQRRHSVVQIFFGAGQLQSEFPDYVISQAFICHRRLIVVASLSFSQPQSGATKCRAHNASRARF